MRCVCVCLSQHSWTLVSFSRKNTASSIGTKSTRRTQRTKLAAFRTKPPDPGHDPEGGFLSFTPEQGENPSALNLSLYPKTFPHTADEDEPLTRTRASEISEYRSAPHLPVFGNWPVWGSAHTRKWPPPPPPCPALSSRPYYSPAAETELCVSGRWKYKEINVNIKINCLVNWVVALLLGESTTYGLCVGLYTGLVQIQRENEKSFFYLWHIKMIFNF